MDYFMPICNKLISTRCHFHTMSRSDLWPTLLSIQCVLRPLSKGGGNSRVSVAYSWPHTMPWVYTDRVVGGVLGGGDKNQKSHHLIIRDVNSTTNIPIAVMIHSITMWNMLLMFISCATNLGLERLFPFSCWKCWVTSHYSIIIHSIPFICYIICYSILMLWKTDLAFLHWCLVPSIYTVYRLEMQLTFCLSLFLTLSLSRYMFRQ
jgi:hypothetical protein